MSDMAPAVRSFDSKAARPPQVGDDARRVSFNSFVVADGARLRQVLVARYGTQVGVDASAAAMGWAWEHWDRIAEVENKVGYLYRVAQSSQRRTWRWQQRTTSAYPRERAAVEAPTSAVDLGAVVALLGDRQRQCVLLVHAHRWSYQEVADVLGISVAAVTNHVHRGTKRLRNLLENE